MEFNLYKILPLTLATMSSILMLSIGITATLIPSQFVGMWLKRGVGDCNLKEGSSPVGYFLVVGGIGAGALAMAVTSLLSLWISVADIVPISRSVEEYLTTSRIVACGTVCVLLVYAIMWYASGMAKRLKTNGFSTNAAFAASLSYTCYALLAKSNVSSGDDTEETALAMIRHFNTVMIPWTLAHYIFPTLLEYTFSIKATPGEVILMRAACSFFMANHVLQASLAWGAESLRSICFMAAVMFVFSLDFQIRHNPRWGYGKLPEGVEVEWTNVNGVRTWSIVSLGIALGLAYK